MARADLDAFLDTVFFIHVSLSMSYKLHIFEARVISGLMCGVWIAYFRVWIKSSSRIGCFSCQAPTEDPCHPAIFHPSRINFFSVNALVTPSFRRLLRYPHLSLRGRVAILPDDDDDVQSRSFELKGSSLPRKGRTTKTNMEQNIAARSRPCSFVHKFSTFGLASGSWTHPTEEHVRSRFTHRCQPFPVSRSMCDRDSPIAANLVTSAFLENIRLGQHLSLPTWYHPVSRSMCDRDSPIAANLVTSGW